MTVRRPNLEQLRSVAEDLGMHMGDAELKSYNELLQGNFAAYEAVDAMPDYPGYVNSLFRLLLIVLLINTY